MSNDQDLINEDLAPTTAAQRTWSMWHIAALWVGMAICIPTYTLASGLIDQGWSLGTAVLGIALGNLVVLVPLLLNAHAGTRYGVPFPVLLRSSFGVLGSNVPALMRAVVACGWFGIQTWIGGSAIYALTVALVPAGWALPDVMPAWFGINTGQFIAFTVFWLINVAIIWRGMDSIRLLETWAAPFLIAVGLALLVWAWVKVGDFGTLVSNPVPPTKTGFSALAIGLTSGVAFWGTLALNIPDFARYARSQRDQVIGQSIGLPPTMTLFAFIGAAVTNATFVIFGERIADPVALLGRIGGPAMTILAMFGLAIATLSTNLAANVVSPANDFSNLAPRKINFRRGALIAASLGFVIMPWKLISDLGAYLFTWLLGYGAMLGAVGGIMICDYFLIRKCELQVDELYKRHGAYSYRGGFNLVALLALAIGIGPLVPGFLNALGVIQAPAVFNKLYEWSWFVAFALAATTHYIGMQLTGLAKVAAASRAGASAPQ